MISHLINGQRTAGGTRQADVFNPATGAVEKRVLLADKLIVEQAMTMTDAHGNGTCIFTGDGDGDGDGDAAVFSFPSSR